jgi:hypothetical protein
MFRNVNKVRTDANNAPFICFFFFCSSIFVPACQKEKTHSQFLAIFSRNLFNHKNLFGKTVPSFRFYSRSFTYQLPIKFSPVVSYVWKKNLKADFPPIHSSNHLTTNRPARQPASQIQSMFPNLNCWSPGLIGRDQSSTLKFRLGPVFICINLD